MFDCARAGNDVVPEELAVVQLVRRTLASSRHLENTMTFTGEIPREMIERKFRRDHREAYVGKFVNLGALQKCDFLRQLAVLLLPEPNMPLREEEYRKLTEIGRAHV